MSFTTKVFIDVFNLFSYGPKDLCAKNKLSSEYDNHSSNVSDYITGPEATVSAASNKTTQQRDPGASSLYRKASRRV